MYYSIGNKIVFGDKFSPKPDWTFGTATDPEPIVDLLNDAVRENRRGNYTKSARMIRKAETMCAWFDPCRE